MESFSDKYRAVSRRSLDLRTNSIGVGITENNNVRFTIDDSYYSGSMKYYLAGRKVNGIIVFSETNEINIDLQHSIKIESSNSLVNSSNCKLAYKGEKQENGIYDYVIMFTNI